MHIPDYYEFVNQTKIISGKSSLEHIPVELDGYDTRKPLVITTGALTRRGIAKKFIKAFYDSDVVLGAFYDAVHGYAGITQVRELAGLFRDRGCDSIIAIGGGEVVDVAKGVNLLVSEKTDTLMPYCDGTAVPGRLKPFLYVPTCHSTGMEMTGTATVDNQTMTSDFLIPDLVVIDPRMTVGCCSECVAETAAVALAHAVGAALDETRSPMTEAYSHSALQSLAGNLAKGIKKPKNGAASVGLANAAVMATVAFSNAPAGMAHLLSEELAKASGLSIGKHLRILLPPVMDRIAGQKNKFRNEMLLAIAGMDAYAATPEKDRAGAGIQKALQLLQPIAKVMPGSLKELKIQKYLLPEIAEKASKKSGKRFSGADCMAVLERAWEGMPV